MKVLPICVSTTTTYIHFLVAAQKVFTCTEAARCHPGDEPSSSPSHDAFTRLLRRQPPDPEALWKKRAGC
ncbi:putative transposase, IS4 family [Candidatus Nitrososphaera gargensis Ga9.2]|uniref:Putative transposase, IS4 family n=1 Tax=Nitrososphaera gargensis (strain Ga9.2) TaxID=1237085 RepID=K0IIH9_NITGG|nr:putative transposase, IS4 family [Candidatus Nitrososphaera gargensis Ga9.2]